MNAEFDVMVKKVNFSSPENMQKPFDSACYSDRGAYIDMDLIMPDGVLHLCGKNDWGCLIADALVPLLQYAHGVEERIRLEYDSQPEKPDTAGFFPGGVDQQQYECDAGAVYRRDAGRQKCA